MLAGPVRSEGEREGVGRVASWATREERLGRLGLGSGKKKEGGSDGPDWVGFSVLPFLILSHFYF